jgi:hypothetical protein
MSRLRRTDPVTRYTVRVGLNYRGLRREPGEVVDDLPEDSIEWLVAQGCVTPLPAEEVKPDGD